MDRSPAMVVNEKEQLSRNNRAESVWGPLSKVSCIQRRTQHQLCKKKFFTLSAMLLHCKEKHERFICVECRESFDSIGALESHRHTTRERERREVQVIFKHKNDQSSKKILQLQTKREA